MSDLTGGEYVETNLQSDLISNICRISIHVQVSAVPNLTEALDA